MVYSDAKAGHIVRLRAGGRGPAGSEVGSEVRGWIGHGMELPGKTREQISTGRFPTLPDAGMPSLDVSRAITVNASEMLGWGDRIGRIEPGELADLVAVAGAQSPISRH